MKDPFKVLGVSPNASDEEIKSAYRELAKKYHPDKYAGSDLADLAEEKMKEVNEAYDQIQKIRSGKGNSSSGGYNSNFGSYDGGGSGRFSDVRRALNNRDLNLAETLLNQVSEPERNAEWHFLSGCVAYNRGYFADAQRFFDIACSMEPSNPEYQNARNVMHRRTAGYGGGYRTTQGGCTGCDICSGLLCADCCCECMGSDCIACC